MERLVDQRTVTLCKLTADVKNPNYNGRYRYSLKARKLFKAGTKLTVTRIPVVLDIDGKKVPGRDEIHITIDGDVCWLSELRDALMAQIEEVHESEQTWEDVYKIDSCGLTESEIIQLMLDKGMVTLDALKALMEENADV